MDLWGLSPVTDPYTNKYINRSPLSLWGISPTSEKDPVDGTRNGTICGRETARSVADRLTLVRSGLSLPTPEPSGRDLAKASGLIAHIADAAGIDETVAAARVADVIDWIPANTYWLARILTVRDLARVWDRLANDYAVSRIEHRRSPDTSTHTHDGQAHATAPAGSTSRQGVYCATALRRTAWTCPTPAPPVYGTSWHGCVSIPNSSGRCAAVLDP